MYQIMTVMYQVISALNLIGSVIGFVMLVQLVRNHTISPLFVVYFMGKLTMVTIIATVNVGTFATQTPILDWPYKAIGTLGWFLAILFTKIIKHNFSTKHLKPKK